MSTLALLREDPSRRALRAITHQIGYGTLARAGAKAAIRSRLKDSVQTSANSCRAIRRMRLLHANRADAGHRPNARHGP